MKETPRARTCCLWLCTSGVPVPVPRGLAAAAVPQREAGLAGCARGVRDCHAWRGVVGGCQGACQCKGTGERGGTNGAAVKASEEASPGCCCCSGLMVCVGAACGCCWRWVLCSHTPASAASATACPLTRRCCCCCCCCCACCCCCCCCAPRCRPAASPPASSACRLAPHTPLAAAGATKGAPAGLQLAAGVCSLLPACCAVCSVCCASAAVCSVRCASAPASAAACRGGRGVVWAAVRADKGACGSARCVCCSWAEGLSHTFVLPGRDAGLEAVAAAAPVFVCGNARGGWIEFCCSGLRSPLCGHAVFCLRKGKNRTEALWVGMVHMVGEALWVGCG